MNTKSAWTLKAQEQPLIIAGPCSAETEAQVLATAHQLKDTGVNIFRAGIWKPRTRPGSFEGIGRPALAWLQRVQAETGLRVATEVANTKHVEQGLQHGIDVLWIGARTTANPFAVQEIADALKGTAIPVLVKNPVNPDVNLWLGAIERLEKAGIKQVGAIHRGISPLGKSVYRNNPEWNMPITLKKLRPDLLLINDPSHIAGNRQLLAGIAETALALHMDGLMIETHLQPEAAWSDAHQQITPQALRELLAKLSGRPLASGTRSTTDLNDMRHSIDYIDEQLIDLLSYRMQVATEIGNYKMQHGLAVFQQERWAELLEKHTSLALSKNLNEEFITQLFDRIHQESVRRQHGVLPLIPVRAVAVGQ
ncbi:bifunctional 3-deoxy-7-phosphoheptulonate synthase/chorismate mutase type II [Pontibacter sp. HSC-14F20]|uniref:bifunctional 3-deoxy-7-phosphoheptulonate synthase/chorismate mutase type II n=1 Tax=Pontibacter sp. HSC-14F20 TaxID=2864136 RepID=UPI001C73B52E|nr:bifunctional 3-deoxy-7-phosphoheptulonate synthase/chorismate mutase type II [Pontibacter sp. HSC-14F20]MBX0335150.1 bifunctional 3-deoxy-7-phosphoheptulonate synthase/chorismate mutase type II [Pontibacter sp. HSC-14F20]